MSLLMKFMRSLRSAPAALPAGPPPPPPAAAAAPAPPREPRASAGPPQDEPPAWRLLDAHLGVQDLDYPDAARESIRALFAHAPRRLLDVGCASGAVGAGLKAAIPGLWVWGCELNERAARVAATRLDHVTVVPREQWGPDDVARLKSVDTVLLLDVLEHMDNPWAELEFLVEHLPDHAQVIVSLPNIGHLSTLLQLARGNFRYEPTGILDVTHIRFFTLADMNEMFEQVGLDVAGTWVLSSSTNPALERFPAQVAPSNSMVLTVPDAAAWQQLNAIQYGFRLARQARRPGQPVPAVAGDPPPWRLLAGQQGVQDHDYGEAERLGVRDLFALPPRRVLDLGCASGAVGGALKRSMPGLWVWGCELNERTAAVAATRLDRVTTVPRAQWTRDELDLLATVDTVLLLDVLEHMYNPWAELEFLSRNLPDTAQVIVSLPNVAFLSVLEGLSRGRFRYASSGILDVTHLRFFTLETMQSMFRETGFEVEAVCVLGGSETRVDRFPASMACGNLQLRVETADDWLRLNTSQFGFRLRARRDAAA